MPIEPSQLGEFGCDCPTLFDDRLFGVRREEEPGFPDGANKDRLWDPLPGADPEYAPHPEFGDLFLGYHDDILDVRGGFRAEHQSGLPMPFDIATPYGKLADTENVLKASIERKGNIVLPREYWRFRPAGGEEPAAYPAGMALPRLSTFRSSTLRQRSVKDGQETLWHLVCSKWDILHPFTAPDLMVSRDGAAFQAARLDGAPCRTLIGSGYGWIAAKRSVWCNGIWTPLMDITAKDLNVTDIRLLDIMDTGTGVALVKHDDGTEKFALIRLVRVVELYPKLRDEDDEIIKHSQNPDPIPESNAMVERDPGAVPTPLPDASAVRIAWRDMRVEVGVPHAGKTITWSMTPRFTPYHVTPAHPEGEPEDEPRFRGKWGTAADVTCRNRFSASVHYDPDNEDYQFTALDPVAEEDTGVQVHQRATTKVDEHGYTAIRVNLPPIGFNKARIRMEIAGLESRPVDLTDLEVPAIVVIDPGHGGADPGAGSISGTMTESEVVLDVGLRAEPHIRQSLSAISENYKVLFTRSDDSLVEIAGNNRFSRQGIQRYHGADIFLSVHCNSGPPTARRVETNIQWGEVAWDNLTPAQADQGNYNHDEDHAFAQEVNDLVAEELQNYDPNTPNQGVKRNDNFTNGPGVLRDSPTANGNTETTTPAWHPLQSALVELEFISNQQGDNLLISGHPNPEPNLQATWVADEVREGVGANIAVSIEKHIKR